MEELDSVDSDVAWLEGLINAFSLESDLVTVPSLLDLLEHARNYFMKDADALARADHSCPPISSAALGTWDSIRDFPGSLQQNEGGSSMGSSGTDQHGKTR